MQLKGISLFLPISGVSQLDDLATHFYLTFDHFLKHFNDKVFELIFVHHIIIILIKLVQHCQHIIITRHCNLKLFRDCSQSVLQLHLVQLTIAVYVHRIECHICE